MLVVVGQADLIGITILKAESDAPIAGDRHAPVALQAALERVETIARQIEISRFLCFVQMQQHVTDAGELVGADLAAVALLIKLLQTPVSKTLNP